MRLTFETRFFILPDPTAPHTDRSIYEKRGHPNGQPLLSRGTVTRTQDPLVPNQMRYRAALITERSALY